MRRFPRSVVVTVLLIATVVCLAAVSDVLVDWFWFDALGFSAVFLTIWKAKLAVFAVTAILVGSALAFNGLLAVRATDSPVRQLRLVRGSDAYEDFADLINRTAMTLSWRSLNMTFAIVLGVVPGLYEASNWDLFLKWCYAVPFGRTDPVLARDLGFYLFSLPVYSAVLNLAFLVVLLATVSALTI